MALPTVVDPVAPGLEVFAQPFDEPGQPTGAGLEKGHPKGRVAVEHPTTDHGRHGRHLVEGEADAVHLYVIVEAVDPDLGHVQSGRPVDTEGQVEFGRQGEERVEIGVVEVAPFQRRRHDGAHQSEVFGASQYGEGRRAVFDGHHGGGVQPTTACPPPTRPPTRCTSRPGARPAADPGCWARTWRSSGTAPFRPTRQPRRWPGSPARCWRRGRARCSRPGRPGNRPPGPRGRDRPALR